MLDSTPLDSAFCHRERMGVGEIRVPVAWRVVAIVAAVFFNAFMGILFADVMILGMEIDGWPITLVMALGVDFIPYWAWRMGLRITETDVIVRNLSYSREFPREAVLRFEPRAHRRRILIYVITAVGEAIPIDVTATNRFAATQQACEREYQFRRCQNLNELLRARSAG